MPLPWSAFLDQRPNQTMICLRPLDVLVFHTFDPIIPKNYHFGLRNVYILDILGITKATSVWTPKQDESTSPDMLSSMSPLSLFLANFLPPYPHPNTPN